MRLLFQKLSRVAPFFYGERGAAEFGRLFHRMRRAPSGSLVPGEEAFFLSLQGDSIEGADLAGLSIRECDFGRARLSRCTLTRASFTGASLRQGRWQEIIAEGMKLEVVDAEEWQGEDIRWEGGAFRLVNFREARLERVDLSHADLLLVDLFGARLRGVVFQGARLTGCDLACTQMKAVDFRDADLRGTSFAHADLDSVDFTSARVEGCDFRGVRGLHEAQRRDLRQRGALLGFRPLRDGLRPLASRLAGGNEQATDRLAGRLSLALGLILTAAIVVPVGMRFLPEAGNQAGPATPPPPPAQKGPPPDFIVGETEIAATRRSYHQIVQAIHEAHTTMVTQGGAPAARWPTDGEMSANAFDLDGNGPGTATAPLLQGGLPPNLLSPSSGVSSYCNKVASQDTLTGDDTDWHYCGETGRVFACGAYTTVATLKWAVEEGQVGPDFSIATASGLPPTVPVPPPSPLSP